LLDRFLRDLSIGQACAIPVSCSTERATISQYILTTFPQLEQIMIYCNRFPSQTVYCLRFCTNCRFTNIVLQSSDTGCSKRYFIGTCDRCKSKVYWTSQDPQYDRAFTKIYQDNNMILITPKITTDKLDTPVQLDHQLTPPALLYNQLTPPALLDQHLTPSALLDQQVRPPALLDQQVRPPEPPTPDEHQTILSSIKTAYIINNFPLFGKKRKVKRVNDYFGL